MHDLAPRTFQRTTPDGSFDLHYRDDGEGPPLLLVHGFFGSGADFAQLPGLGEGMRRIVPDLRGHGGSYSALHRFGFHAAAHDLAALLAALGVARCHALGLSGGAFTLLRLAALRPQTFASLVLVSACDQFTPDTRAFMRSYIEAAARDPDAAPSAQRDALLACARGFAAGEDDATLSPVELGRIGARTLLVSGDRDPLYPLEVSLRLYRALPRASLWIMPDAGHTPVFGAGSAAFVRAAHGCFGAER